MMGTQETCVHSVVLGLERHQIQGLESLGGGVGGCVTGPVSVVGGADGWGGSALSGMQSPLQDCMWWARLLWGQGST